MEKKPEKEKEEKVKVCVSREGSSHIMDHNLVKPPSMSMVF